ncbi:MAG: transporter [Aeromicrobium sp.]|nr:transporter [Aeromicrobium sp.]
MTFTESPSSGARGVVGEVVLDVQGLTVDFVTDHGWTRVVSDVSFSIGRGEILAVVGESGSGKSVMGLACLGLLPKNTSRVSAGSVAFKSNQVLSLPKRQLENLRGNRIAMVFQEPMTSLNPVYRVGDQIAEVVRRHRGASRREARTRALEVLDLVGIPRPAERASAYPHEFSGGMRQRVMIAMALACEPDVLIADEPTTALDVTIQVQVLDLLRGLRDQLGMAVLFITHDLGVVADIADRAMVMYGGHAVEMATVYDLFARPRHPYAEGLMRSMPQVGTSGRRLESIPGQPPVPWALPTGCRFSPRCPYAIEACRREPPPLMAVGEDHEARCLRAHELHLRGSR